MSQGNNKTLSIIMVVCAVIMVGATLFSHVASTGEQSGIAEATTILAQKNQEDIVALQITLGQLEIQMTQISKDIAEIKQDIKKLRTW